MPQIADRKSMARYICVDKGATHPALQREELPKHMAIYADYGVTGTDLRQRPELNRLLTDCRAGRVNCIVAQSTTHLARRTADLLTILQELQSLDRLSHDITTLYRILRFLQNYGAVLITTETNLQYELYLTGLESRILARAARTRKRVPWEVAVDAD